jgi:hypothetical protein
MLSCIMLLKISSCDSFMSCFSEPVNYNSPFASIVTQLYMYLSTLICRWPHESRILKLWHSQHSDYLQIQVASRFLSYFAIGFHSPWSWENLLSFSASCLSTSSRKALWLIEISYLLQGQFNCVKWIHSKWDAAFCKPNCKFRSTMREVGLECRSLEETVTFHQEFDISYPWKP